MPPRLRADDPSVQQLKAAVLAGDVPTVQRTLLEHPRLVPARIVRGEGRSITALHIVADWPGHFPNGPATVRALVAAGADVNAAGEGQFAETALHWAASSDDREVAEALIDAGANIQAPGGSIAEGSPLDNAVGYACWDVARLLVQRGAPVNRLWHAGGLGLTRRLEELLSADPTPTHAQINQAFWHACSGGQRRAAEYLLAHGADLGYVPEYARDTPLGAAGGLPTQRQLLVDWLRSRGAR